MRNLLNIDDKVRVKMQGFMGDGQIVKVTQIDLINDEIYYLGVYHYNCPDGGEGYETSIQFKEGQYERIDNVNTVTTTDIPTRMRCKFRCHYREDLKDPTTGEVTSATIKMSPVYAETGENKEFWKYTPAGDISLYVVNPTAVSIIEQNEEYYVDISKAK